MGIADEISDIDLIVFYAALPHTSMLDSLCGQVNGSPQIYSSTTHDECRFKEGYYVDGVRCDITHLTIAAFEEDMAEVLDAFSTDAYAQSRVSGMMDSMALYGNEFVDDFRAKASNYASRLAHLVVEKHLKFQPFWVMTDMGVKRDELLFLYQTFVESETNIVGALCGLNQVYLPGEFKRIEQLSSKLRFAPQDLVSRLKAVFQLEPEAAANELCTLIRDTFALVERHMPEFDTSESKRWFELPRPDVRQA
jgi:hypothetical protein